ncbi:MAG: DUF1254 domain-containing protein [Woeseiaceae bacterium]
MLSRRVVIVVLFLLATLGPFLAARAILIQQAPIKVMSTIEARIVEAAGGWNRCYHNRTYGPRMAAARRANPDSMISSMAYDLADGPVRISGEVWSRYWSLSFYQQNTDNFFVMNDQQIDGATFDVVLTTAEQGHKAEQGDVIVSPTTKGIMLIRRFAASEADMPGILENQDKTQCSAIS